MDFNSRTNFDLFRNILKLFLRYLNIFKEIKMKNLLAYLAILLFSGCFYKDVSINGTAAGIKDAVIEISKDKNVWAANIENNRFSIPIKLEKPDFYTLKLLAKGKLDRPVSHLIYLEKGDYTINLDSAHIRKYPTVTTESGIQNDLNEYFTDSGKEKNKLEKFIPNHPESLASAYLLSSAQKSIAKDPVGFLRIYNYLSEDMKATSFGKESKSLIDAHLRNIVGASMPDIKGIMLDGKAFNKNSIKGKLTLIAFWASWNEPSTDDIQQLKMLHNELHPKGFEILSIAIDKYEEKWKKYIKDNEMNWLHAADFKGAYSENFEQFNTNMLPYYIIIGPDLKIVDHGVPIESVKIYFNDFIRDSSKE